MTSTTVWFVTAPDFAGLPDLTDAAALVVAEVRVRMGARQAGAPFLIAIDGGSGSGKSTLAALVAAELGAAVVPGDDFFAAEMTSAEWDALSPAERASAAIDWRRLRRDALEPLLAGKVARWHPFDFAAGSRPDGTYPMAADAVTLQQSPVIVLDGAYASRPELADLIDLSVVVDTPLHERHRRIAAREEKSFADAWHARWDAAEDHYFSNVRPPLSFDLVVR